MDEKLTNSLTLAMQNLMQEHLHGKKFVYRSKYGGETFGIVDTVLVSLIMTWDDATSENLKNSLDYFKGGRKKERKPAIPVTNYYSAFRPTVSIKSTNNISYELSQIFILN